MNSIFANLHFSCAVTTNIDQSYEKEFSFLHPNDELNIIPYKISSHSKSWLLKLNGCISNPDSIVVSRQDYLRYMETNAALAGIVQAKLLTSHLLFIGFSLNDENFHIIMDSVMKARKDDSSCVGTALQPLFNPFSSELWAPTINSISMNEAPKNSYIDKNLSLSCSWQTEVFLDLVLLSKHCFSCEYILDCRFNTILSSEERGIFNSMEALRRKLEAARFSPNFVQDRFPDVCNTFQRYGQALNLPTKIVEKPSPKTVTSFHVDSPATAEKKSKRKMLLSALHLD